MRVLFLASTLPRFPNDLQAPFVLEQAAAWKAARPEDAVTILAPHDAAAARHEWIGSVEVRRFQYFLPARLQALAYPAILPNLRRNPLVAAQIPPFLLAEFAAARRLVRDNRIDLVYAHWVMPQGLIARWLLRAANVPYVVQNHSSDLAVFSKAGRFGRAAARAVLRDARVMFCVNRQQKADALALFDAASQPAIANKIRVLPMGVGLDVSAVRASGGVSTRYSLTGSEPAEEPASAGDVGYRYVLGMVSRLSRKKGIDLFISAAEQLAEEGVSVPIGIAGDGEDREVLKAIPRRADITFTGFLLGADKLRFFNESRFMVFPSVSSGGDVEGLPVALLEALCCGKVVIAGRDTNVMLLPEWKQIAKDVFLLDDPRDTEAFIAAIRALLALDSAEVAARSARLRATMARYLWDRLITDYLDAIDAVGPSSRAQEAAN